MSKHVNTASLPVSKNRRKDPSAASGGRNVVIWDSSLLHKGRAVIPSAGAPCPRNGEFCLRTAAARLSQLLTGLSRAGMALLAPENWENTWPLSLPGTTSTISYWLSLTLPHTGVWVAQVTKPWGTMAAPGFEKEFKKGVKESHSKSSLPFSYTGLLSAPPAPSMVSTLGPLDLNFLTLSCFPTRWSQGWLLPILQSHCKYYSLKKPLPRHPSKATYRSIAQSCLSHSMADLVLCP